MKRLLGGAVLDASVGVKFVVAEAGHETARALLERLGHRESPVAMPEFAALEVANALWAKTRRRELTATLAREALALFLRATAGFLRVPERLLATDALTIALHHGVTAYDGCYLALARRMGLPLVTADVKLARPGLRGGFQLVLLGDLVT